MNLFVTERSMKVFHKPPHKTGMSSFNPAYLSKLHTLTNLYQVNTNLEIIGLFYLFTSLCLDACMLRIRG